MYLKIMNVNFDWEIENFFSNIFLIVVLMYFIISIKIVGCLIN